MSSKIQCITCTRTGMEISRSRNIIIRKLSLSSLSLLLCVCTYMYANACICVYTLHRYYTASNNFFLIICASPATGHCISEMFSVMHFHHTIHRKDFLNENRWQNFLSVTCASLSLSLSPFSMYVLDCKIIFL